MRCGSVIVAIVLAACATHPTGLALAITPGVPGDTVELYFGTTQGADPILDLGVRAVLDRGRDVLRGRPTDAAFGPDERGPPADARHRRATCNDAGTELRVGARDHE